MRHILEPLCDTRRRDILSGFGSALRRRICQRSMAVTRAATAGLPATEQSGFVSCMRLRAPAPARWHGGGWLVAVRRNGVWLSSLAVGGTVVRRAPRARPPISRLLVRPRLAPPPRRRSALRHRQRKRPARSRLRRDQVHGRGVGGSVGRAVLGGGSSESDDRRVPPPQTATVSAELSAMSCSGAVTGGKRTSGSWLTRNAANMPNPQINTTIEANIAAIIRRTFGNIRPR